MYKTQDYVPATIELVLGNTTLCKGLDLMALFGSPRFTLLNAKNVHIH